MAIGGTVAILVTLVEIDLREMAFGLREIEFDLRSGEFGMRENEFDMRLRPIWYAPRCGSTPYARRIPNLAAKIGLLDAPQ